MGIAIDFQQAKRIQEMKNQMRSEHKAIMADLEDSKQLLGLMDTISEYLKYFGITELLLDQDSCLTEIDGHIIPGLAIKTFGGKIIHLEVNVEERTIRPTILTDLDLAIIDDVDCDNDDNGDDDNE